MRIFYPEGDNDPHSTPKRGSPPASRLPNVSPDSSASDPRKSGKSSGSTPGVTDDERKKQGVMKFSGTGKPPVPKDLFPHPRTSKMTYLCGNASTVGYLCQRGPNACNFVHIQKSQDLTPPNRQLLKTFIENHADLTFARNG
jgi:hypothetical protein